MTGEPGRALARDRIAGIGLGLVAGWTAWESRGYPLGTLAEPGPGFLPLVLAVTLLVFALALVIGGAAPRPTSFADAPHALLLLAVLAGAALLLERLGYRLTIIAMLAILLGAIERRRWYMVVAVSLAVAFASHWLINDVLRTPLPRGPWGL